MKCRYCNIALAPLRTLTDGEFCCDEHRREFIEQGGEVVPYKAPEGGLVALNAALECITPVIPEPQLKPPLPLEFRPKTMAAPAFSAAEENHEVKAWFRLPGHLLKLKFGAQLFNSPERAITHSTGEPQFRTAPVLPGAKIEPEAVPAAIALAEQEGEPADEFSEPRFQHLAAEAANSWRWLVDTWRKAPSELRIITVLVPILLALAVSPSTPKMTISRAPGNSVKKVVAEQLKDLNKNIENRAAIAYTDDFRSGLDGWESRSNLTTRWSYDATGFVQPGPLAVFRPSVDLTDYRFEFLAEIDKKGMGCAFRAPNLDNYYAVKFVVAKPGPLPEVHVVRYAVIGGKEGPRVEKPVPFVTRADMLYRVQVDVRGSDFTLRAQDQIVDFWSDARIPRGGVGLFCGRGEKARVRWLEVSHQYDTLGRVCAYLTPIAVEGRNGNFN